MDYFEYMPRKVMNALTEAELQWISLEYESKDFLLIRKLVKINCMFSDKSRVDANIIQNKILFLTDGDQ